MRRKLKPISRGRSAAVANLVQRTILPKNSEYIAIIPMMPGAPIPSHSTTEGQQTILGHPINGIQTSMKVVSTACAIKTTTTLSSSTTRIKSSVSTCKLSLVFVLT